MNNAARLIEEAEYIIRPQPGPQTEFLKTPVDICVYGGAAGGGKTYGLLLECLRYIDNPDSKVLVFRREAKQVKNPGGLLSVSRQIFTRFGGTFNQQNMAWTFPSGATVTFSHLNTEDTVYSYQGAQVSAILFDELTHFYESQFWYMLSRLRSESGIAGYVRATTNPDSESWVAKLVEWYIDDEGFPIPDRAGKERYFFRRNDQIFFGKDPQELFSKGAQSEDIKTFAFIPASIEDNQILLETDPSYMSNLRSLSEVEKQRLLYGNWKIKQTGSIFQLSDFNNYIIAPKIDYKAIFVDTASKDGAKNDYSVIHLWGLGEKGIYDLDQMRGKWKYSELKSILNAFLAKHSDINALFIEDKSAGIPLIQEIRATTRYPVKPIPRHTDKFSRAYQCTGYVESGRVFLNPASRYYTDFVAELSSFSADKKGRGHDDQVDCMMDAIEQLLIKKNATSNHTLNVNSFLSQI